METPVKYISNWISEHENVFSVLKNDLEWVRRGKTPRKEYYCNKIKKPYTYGSNGYYRSYEPNKDHYMIDKIGNKLLKDFGYEFEACFLNFYENQREHLGWHSDDSPEVDNNRPIAIVSFGVSRDIWFKEIGKSNAKENVEKLTLESGSLCLMLPNMQKTHYHRIPKHDRECGERISLTFRGFNYNG